jgi:hypothetical protein
MVHSMSEPLEALCRADDTTVTLFVFWRSYHHFGCEYQVNFAQSPIEHCQRAKFALEIEQTGWTRHLTASNRLAMQVAQR